MKTTGFTGTQNGMTDLQRRQVRQLIRGSSELHHGDCVGADAEAHFIAIALRIPVVQHPPSDAKKRAFSPGGKVLPPQPYLVRNHAIVDAVDQLVAAPSGPEQLRSGTWATIRYARRQGKPVFIVMPHGEIQKT